MNNQQLKTIIAAYLADGVPLSDIQDRLESEHDYKIKFFDLRMLAAELEDVEWERFDPKAPEPADVTKAPTNSAPTNVPPGETHVTVSKIARPGMAMCGSVNFASGASADWCLDTTGRPGIENVVGEPSQQDVELFMVELRKLLSGGGY